MESEQLSFVSALSFSNSLVEKRMNSMRTLFKFFDGFGEIYQNEKKKLPFHINIIDELRADENAHSRILAKFLMYEDLISREYDIFKSFIGYLVENYNNKKHFQKIEVKWPTLTVEKERIDLWIRDSNYVLIVENKVQNAGDQYKQLERYIDTSKNYGYKEEDIYVLYLPPTYEKEPDTESWGKYYETDIYNNRYLKLSFRNDVLPWLKNDVLPNVRIKERLLMSSLEQYIDHLEGKFSLRTINIKMNMKLQEFIKENLEITNAEPEYSLTKVLEKKEEVEDALNQLKQLEHSIKIDYFKKWEKCLKDKYKDFDIISDWSQGNKTNYLGVKIVEGESIFSLIIGYNIQSIYYGISRHFATDAKDNRLNFEEIITELNLAKDEFWYGYRITSFENAYMRLSALIDKVVNKKQYQIKDTSIGVDISVNQIKSTTHMTLQLLQWNISYSCKIDKIADFILANIGGNTIVCLQEVLAMHKDRLIERLAPSDYAYSLDYREPGLFDGKNRRMGVLTMLFEGVIEEAKVLERSVFPDRTLYTKTRIGNKSVSLLNFHSITGVGYNKAKGANFASIAEFLHETVDLDFFCCDANEPQVDSFDVNDVKFWKANRKEASLIFGKNKVHHLCDPVQYDKLDLETLPFSHITGKNRRRYDFIYRSDRWRTNRLEFYYDKSIEATSDHAMVVGVFNQV